MDNTYKNLYLEAALATLRIRSMKRWSAAFSLIFFPSAIIRFHEVLSEAGASPVFIFCFMASSLMTIAAFGAIMGRMYSGFMRMLSPSIFEKNAIFVKRSSEFRRLAL